MSILLHFLQLHISLTPIPSSLQNRVNSHFKLHSSTEQTTNPRTHPASNTFPQELSKSLEKTPNPTPLRFPKIPQSQSNSTKPNSQQSHNLNQPPNHPPTSQHTNPSLIFLPSIPLQPRIHYRQEINLTIPRAPISYRLP